MNDEQSDFCEWVLGELTGNWIPTRHCAKANCTTARIGSVGDCDVQMISTTTFWGAYIRLFRKGEYLTVVEHARVLIENGINESDRTFTDGYPFFIDAVDLLRVSHVGPNTTLPWKQGVFGEGWDIQSQRK